MGGESASVPVGRVGPKADEMETISSSETVARRVESPGGTAKRRDGGGGSPGNGQNGDKPSKKHQIGDLNGDTDEPSDFRGLVWGLIRSSNGSSVMFRMGAWGYHDWLVSWGLLCLGPPGSFFHSNPGNTTIFLDVNYRICLFIF